MMICRHIDPVGAQDRKKRRLKRRVYVNEVFIIAVNTSLGNPDSPHARYAAGRESGQIVY